MPMTRDEHESFLTDLLNPEIEQSKKSEILQNLRVDYGKVLADHEDLNKKVGEQDHAIRDLTLANSKLFRDLGVQDRDPKELEKDQEKTFSETVRIEDFEKK
jgi:hypothetical protein